MRIAKLVHNPTAGEGEHSKKELKELLAAKGFEAQYSSTKKDGWEQMEDETELVIVAGGDGTIKKVVLDFMEKKLHEQRPIALLPSGTANNIAKTLNIYGEKDDIIESWHKNIFRKFSIGKLSGLKDNKFFLESFGFGLFPKLMRDMDEVPEEETDSPEKEITAARKKMFDSIEIYKPIACKLTIDDKDFSGNYFLLEIMNTRAIGPNLVLAPKADPGDNLLEVILVDESNIEVFKNYLSKLLAGKEMDYPIKPIEAKKIALQWSGKEAHVDDKIIKLDNNDGIEISLMEEMLDFFVTE